MNGEAARPRGGRGLQEDYGTERQLLDAACTRDLLLITSAGPASGFLDDLHAGGLQDDTHDTATIANNALNAVTCLAACKNIRNRMGAT